MMERRKEADIRYVSLPVSYCCSFRSLAIIEGHALFLGIDLILTLIAAGVKEIALPTPNHICRNNTTDIAATIQQSCSQN